MILIETFCVIISSFTIFSFQSSVNSTLSDFSFMTYSKLSVDKNSDNLILFPSLDAFLNSSNNNGSIYLSNHLFFIVLS